MSIKTSLTVIALSALLLSGISPAAYGKNEASAESVSGIIVKYEKGVAPVAKDGEPTGANLLRGLASSSDLGGGLYSLTFLEKTKLSEVRTWVERMTLDRRIAWAQPNLAVVPTAVSPKELKLPVLAKARAASGPRSLAVVAAVTSTSPDKARVRLSWRTPSNLYGATIVGYRVQYSSDSGKTYRNLVSNTGSSARKIFLSDGIRAGINYRFRVRAITNNGSGTNTVGAISNTVQLRVRTSPKPVYITSGARVGPGTVTFIEQSLSDRGGYSTSSIRYSAIASFDTEVVESSSCTLIRCSFPTLAPDTEYKIEVFASNPKGTSSSEDRSPANDGLFSLQWYLTGKFGISMPTAWRYSKGDNSKVVAVIDTGIKEHQQINKSLLRNPDGSIYGYDFVSDLASAADGDSEDSNPNDEGGDASGGSSYHGTFVSGLITSEHDLEGTAGVAPRLKILPIRALGRNGGTISDLVKAINWAAGVTIEGVPKNKYRVSVINLSLGATELVSCDGDLATVFESAVAKGITIVAAAGNEARPSLSFPANCPGVVTVAATQSLGDRASYSNFGEGVLVSAPGGEQAIGSSEAPNSQGMILSSAIDNQNVETYRLFEGTSMAAPVVSGLVALMYAMQPSITPARVRNILVSSVRPFPTGSTCLATGGCGSGIINAHLALAKTSALK